jgi:hypothetical protein
MEESTGCSRLSSALADASSLGDFQTPVDLATLVWSAVDVAGVTAVVEPTVGTGSFIKAAPAGAVGLPWYAFDIHDGYVGAAQAAAKERQVRAAIRVKSAFDLEQRDFPGVAGGSVILLIGNPPWVTNADQGGAGADNLPAKSNRFRLAGLAAMTGKANFDIAEAILLAALAALRDASEVRVALLMKRSVALKIAQDVMTQGGAAELAFSAIDAKQWFGASVDAGLLQMTWRASSSRSAQTIRLFKGIRDSTCVRAGIVGGQFVHRCDQYGRVRHIEAGSADEALPWRQGIKHDAARLLELRTSERGIVNGLDEPVDVEDDVLCPLYKSSDLANGRGASRLFPLYQFDLTGPAADLGRRWPKLEAYLQRHRARLDARRSRIYSGRPPFMLFGVGPYTTAPYKIAVSGLYKRPRFVVLGPSATGAPPLVDDTCNLLPFDTLAEAEEIAAYLNSLDVSAFLAAVADPTAKRPYTVEVLRRIRDPRCFDPPLGD